MYAAVCPSKKASIKRVRVGVSRILAPRKVKCDRPSHCSSREHRIVAPAQLLVPSVPRSEVSPELLSLRFIYRFHKGIVLFRDFFKYYILKTSG